MSKALEKLSLKFELVVVTLTLNYFLALQLVGQKLLFHATQQLPVLACLPHQVKDSIIQALYTRPFVQAIRMVSL